MDNDNFTQSTDTEQSSQNSSKIKDYGKKSMAPLVELVHKYQDQIVPYVTAIGKGLQASADALNGSSLPRIPEGEELSNDIAERAPVSGADQAVGQWFGDAAGWFNGALEKIQSGNSAEFLDYLETLAKKNPSLMFSSSYIVGLVFGRMGRHLGQKMMNENFDGLKH